MQVKATLVSNEFIDQLMIPANGEFVKVYLYLLCHIDEAPGIAQIADALGMTESDVKRAITYWEKQGALTPPAGVFGGDTQEPAPKRTSDQVVIELPLQPSARRIYTADQLDDLGKRQDFRQLLYVAESYLKKTLTYRETEVLAYLYDGLELSADLLEHLIETCVVAGHTNLRYMEKTAVDWHEKGISTVAQAREQVPMYSKDMYAVMKEFGLGKRQAAPAEVDFMKRWFFDYGFSRPVVLEACRRTVLASHTPDFKYTEGILKRWHEAGVQSKEDIERLDQTHREKQAQEAQAGKAKGSRTGGKAKPAKATGFHNFDARDTDYEQIVDDDIRRLMQIQG
jgi:DnaD/phage-associated family protein